MTQASLTIGERGYRVSWPDEGYDEDVVVKSWKRGDVWEIETLRLIEHAIEGHAGRAAIDCGAHLGNHSLYFSRLFDVVIAVEACETSFGALVDNMAVNGVANVEAVRAVACEHNEGEETLRVWKDQPCLAFTAARCGVNQWAEGRDDALVKETCPRRTLDSIRQQVTVEPVALIKIDVEGCELEAVQGAAEIIVRDRPVLWLESWPHRRRSYNAAMQRIGYELWARIGEQCIYKAGQR